MRAVTLFASSSERLHATFRIDSLNSRVATLRILRRTFFAFFFSAYSFASSPQNKQHFFKQKSDSLTRALVRGGLFSDVLT